MSLLIAKFIVFTLIAFVSPKIIRGVRVRSLGAAAAVAIVFALINLLIGWLITLLITVISIPFIIVTLGLFWLLIPTLINAFLLWLTDLLLEPFELKGWFPALAMGFLFALGGIVVDYIF